MQLRCLVAGLICASVLVPGTVWSQVIRPVDRFSTEGTLKSIRSGQIEITDRTGKSWQMRIGNRSDGRVLLGASRVFSAPAPRIEISGEVGLGKIEPGSQIRFSGYVNDKGNLTGEISQLAWADGAGFKPGVKVDRKKTDEQGNVPCVVSGTVETIDNNRLTVRVPRSRYASKGKMIVRLAGDTKVSVKTRDLSKLQEGDLVSHVSGFELNTGDLVIQQLEIRLAGDSKPEPTPKNRRKRAETSEQPNSKYEKYSAEKVAPRQVRSQHYIVRTDLSDRDTKVLIDKLEDMLRLISVYFGRPQPAPVECYVVSDLKAWQEGVLPDDAKEKITSKQGITKKQSAASLAGRQAKAVVYACDSPGVVQHEAVHAYCHLAFGSTGPAWYSEGMAELGKYWKDGQRAVDIDEDVIKYLKKTKTRKTLKEIVAPGEITGNLWQEYTWRWALCHLLANNPNYNRKFKELGVGLMMERPGVSLSTYYGNSAKQLTFEYDHFLQHVENGYRADLCAWRWKHKFEPVEQKGHNTVKVLAKAGWQPGVRVAEGVEYDYVAKGEWQIDGTGTKSSADGDQQGNGKLMAVIMREFELGEPIPLGAKGRFKAPATGNLYLRCGEAWSRLGDNSGGVTAYLRLSK